MLGYIYMLTTGHLNVRKHKEKGEKIEKLKKKMKVTNVSHSRKQVLKSKPKAISKPDVAVAHKPINIPKQLSQPISSPQSMMSRLLTCTNLIQVHQALLSLIPISFLMWLGQLSTLQKNKIDQVAFWCIPIDALSRTLPVDIVGDGNCCPRSFSYALFGTEEYHREFRSFSYALFGTEEYHREFRLLSLRKGLFNWKRYLDY